MTKNMGVIDRSLRLLAVAIVGVLYLTHSISGTLAAVLGVIAILFVVTSVMGYCPMYIPFGLSTRKEAQTSPARS